MVASMERYYKALREVKGAPVMSMDQIKRYVDRVGADYPKAYKELKSAGVTADQVSKATGVPVETIMQRIKGANAPKPAGLAGIMQSGVSRGMSGQG